MNPPGKEVDRVFDLARIYSCQPDALVREFSSLGEWEAFCRTFEVTDYIRAKAIAARVARLGVSSVQFGAVPDAQTVELDPLHWDVLVNGMGNIQRSVGDLIAATRFADDKVGTRIFAAEALSPFAMSLRAAYPHFIGTQYMPDEATRRRHFPIQHQDLGELTFPDGAFDVVATIEVLEHVPYLDRALSEMARVLAPGGVMLSTFPFRWDAADTQQNAMLVNGAVHHLVDTPEIHGDPMSEEGALVFQLPGWDIVDRAVQAGFASARMIFYSSAVGGLFGHDLIGRFVFAAYR